jgi:hypothetical protein
MQLMNAIAATSTKEYTRMGEGASIRFLAAPQKWEAK